ncbi:MAG TPA: sialidase family protein, partial [Gemmatimonadaceae bacterium]|nr:sialidase family protein [Gemmatimonadaceae bacterium]
EWGVFRHYWVVFKLLINVFSTIVLLMYIRTVGYFATVAADTTLSSSDLLALRSVSPVVHASAAILLLLVATTLAVYKPRGLTPHGLRIRKQRSVSQQALLRQIVFAIAISVTGAACSGERSSEAPSVATVRLDSIASPAAPGSAEPNLGVSPDGRVYMSWLEPNQSGHALRVAALEGSEWSPAQTVRAGRDFFVNWADFPSIEVLDGGRLAVHWLQRNGSGTYAYGVRISQSGDDGKTWSTPVMPHRDSSQTEHGFVGLWREAGALGAVWLDGRNFSKEGHDASNEMMLLATAVHPDGKLGDEVTLDERTCDCCQNSAALTADGPIVAYRDRSPDEIRDIYVTRRVGGTWTPGTPVHSDNWNIAACPVNGPAVTASGRRVAVAWFTAANDSPRVKLAFSDDAGATFRAPIRADGGNPAGRVDVAMLPDGSALVTWIERTGGDTAAVQARRVHRDGKIGETTMIGSSSAARASGFPQMAVVGSDVFFAWTVPGENSAVRVARARLSDFQ